MTEDMPDGVQPNPPADATDQERADHEKFVAAARERLGDDEPVETPTLVHQISGPSIIHALVADPDARDKSRDEWMAVLHLVLFGYSGYQVAAEMPMDLLFSKPGLEGMKRACEDALEHIEMHERQEKARNN